MTFKDTKDLCFFIKECTKLGITEFQMGDMKIFFSPPAASWKNPRSKRNATVAAHDIEHEGEKQIDEAANELYLSQLAVDDPEEFERVSIKGING
jgi:hypothetical protein